MKTSEHIFSKIHERIHSEEFKLKYRVTPKAFTRKCNLSLPFLVTFVLNQIKKSNSAEIDTSTTFLNRKKFTKSAFSKARIKFLPEAFIELNDVLLENFYKNRSNFERFCGFIVFAIDGSKFQLPEGDSLQIKFGSSSNQSNINMNMAQGSQLIDVINGIVVHSLISHCNSSERDLAEQHLDALIQKRSMIPQLSKSIVLFDRGYPSMLFIAKLIHYKIPFIMRCGRGFLKVINDFVDTGKKGGKIEISLKNLSKCDQEELLKACPGLDVNTIIVVRVIVIVLRTGEKEILLTSLLDTNKYKYKRFKEFYSLRWGAETIYAYEKVRWGIENFSGKSEISVKQDYYASILSFNMTIILAIEAKKELDRSKKIEHRKYEYKINYSIALAYVKNRFMSALLNPDIKPKQFCSDVKELMKKNLEPIRPGRQFEHKRKYPSKRFPTNTRGVI